jgi:hypothetical protein
MPFITSEARRMADQIGPKEVGDQCFLYYREMLRAWRASPRWTTAHEIYFDMRQRTNGDIGMARELNDIAAHELAWQVFFQLHVIPYELQKRTMNGEIDY